ncbi:MAG TPA: NUDIX domain-containing protein [Patescibacteria group bacterium]|nr:NUDIX domain-containing protein [Patescibacteria group bacterium]
MSFFQDENEPFPIPTERASLELYKAAHANFAIGYTDLVPRDPKTGKLFFVKRAIEPQKGASWFIGGRITPGKTNGESAAEHLEKDTGIKAGPGRFQEVSHWTITHVTPSEGEEGPDVRHCQNTVLVIDLTPEEIQKLNEGKLSDEYDGESGKWFDPEKIDKTEFLPPVRQFFRDYFSHEVMMDAIHSQAVEEYRHHLDSKL